MFVYRTVICEKIKIKLNMNKEDIINQYIDIANNYKQYNECYNELIKTNDINNCKYCLDIDGI